MFIEVQRLKSDTVFLSSPWSSLPNFVNQNTVVSNRCNFVWCANVSLEMTLSKDECNANSVKPLHKGHLGDRRKWPLLKGGRFRRGLGLDSITRRASLFKVRWQGTHIREARQTVRVNLCHVTKFSFHGLWWTQQIGLLPMCGSS